jgi:hypothetical protein
LRRSEGERKQGTAVMSSNTNPGRKKKFRRFSGNCKCGKKLIRVERTENRDSRLLSWGFWRRRGI